MSVDLLETSVTVGRESYTLEFSLCCQYVADSRKIDVAHLRQIIIEPGPGKLALVLDLFAAMVAHNFVRANKPVPTAEWWSLQLSEQEMPAISKAVLATLGKWLGVPQAPAATPQTEAAPAVQ